MVSFYLYGSLPGTELTAIGINFHKQENRKAHKTDDNEMQQLIVRRGLMFDVTVTFNRDYNPEDDVFALQFITGTFLKSLDFNQYDMKGLLV